MGRKPRPRNPPNTPETPRTIPSRGQGGFRLPRVPRCQPCVGFCRQGWHWWQESPKRAVWGKYDSVCRHPEKARAGKVGDALARAVSRSVERRSPPCLQMGRIGGTADTGLSPPDHPRKIQLPILLNCRTGILYTYLHQSSVSGVIPVNSNKTPHLISYLMQSKQP